MEVLNCDGVSEVEDVCFVFFAFTVRYPARLALVCDPVDGLAELGLQLEDDFMCELRPCDV